MVSDWHPGRVTKEYRDNYPSIFNEGKHEQDQESVSDGAEVGERAEMPKVPETRR